MNIKQIESIIFDLDGTLIDTEPSAALAIQEFFQKWNITIQEQDANYVTGRTWESAFNYLFRKYPVPIPIENAKISILKSYRDNLETHLITVPGSVEAVKVLATQFPLALVSGSNRSDILFVLKKLGIFEKFQIILGAEDYLKSKPHPDGYLKALKELGTPPQSCLVFEDSTAGISSARAAGVWVVAVTLTNHFGQDLSLAHMKIKDFQGISVQWIKNLKFV